MTNAGRQKASSRTKQPTMLELARGARRGAPGPSLRCAVGARRPGCTLCAACGGATPRATEIFLDPGIRLAHQLLDGADLNTLVHQNRNTVADGVERDRKSTRLNSSH